MASNSFKLTLNASFLAVAAAAMLLSAGCAHHRDVRAGVDGVHWINIKAETTEQGTREALSQANHFCEKRNLAAAVVKEEEAYVGSMNEKDYKALKTAGTVAQTAGGAAYVLGGGSNNPTVGGLGGIVGLGGTMAKQVAGEGYQVKLRFKCI